MNDPASEAAHAPNSSGNTLLVEPEDPHMPNDNKRNNETERNWLPWIVAAIAIVFALGLAFLITRHGIQTGSTAPVIDPYAAHLSLSNVHVNHASNFAGDQITYIDGTISNHGDRTVTSITVRVLFANDYGDPPQAERVPLDLVQSRQPYPEIKSVSAAPLRPGSSQDFRLVFDDVSPLWNQRVPDLKLQNIATH